MHSEINHWNLALWVTTINRNLPSKYPRQGCVGAAAVQLHPKREIRPAPSLPKLGREVEFQIGISPGMEPETCSLQGIFLSYGPLPSTDYIFC